MQHPVWPVSVVRNEGGIMCPADDLLVTEEPLEIRLGYGPLEERKELRLSVTMRTPGHDAELVTGFLLTEGLIAEARYLLRVVPCMQVKQEELGNVVRAELDPSVVVDTARWQRNFYTSSSCGVCGKTSLEAVTAQCAQPLSPWGAVNAAFFAALPERMRSAQTVFQHTGGIHAAALFNTCGELLLLHEDVGRHNAVDKVIGAAHLAHMSLRTHALLVSGRAGFELVQKCILAGIPAMASVGAPSSLAVRLARENRLTLVGFLRGERFNIYAGPFQ
jgi:FdhD protein